MYNSVSKLQQAFEVRHSGMNVSGTAADAQRRRSPLS
jgi:hypothetical protein